VNEFPAESPSQSPSPQAVADPRGERVAAAVRSWQRHLVDLGGRNTLLWYRDLPSGTLDLTTAHPGGVAMLMAGRPTKLSDLVREPAALQEARRRARTIRAKAIELQEERGITAGFIAVGMATWRVAGASRAPAAPVLLRSCVLKATGAAQQDFALDLGADVELNPVLEHYLRSEQGLEMDADALADLSMVSKGFDPHPTFAALQRLCSGIPDFSISPRLVVGTFSYAKLPMVADLAAQGDTLADHDVVAALAGDPDALKAVRTAIPAAPANPEPDREHLVLDADSSQQAVIEAVRAGANLVIKGPPGTGKSQTIANLIASLAGDGKRVLFVAEKRAAIDAVVGRLDRLGLGDLVLDAHSGATNRRRLAQELGATLERASDAADPDTAEVERTLLERRARLTDHAAALHERREPWGVSAYDAQVALTRLTHRRNAPTSRVRIHGDALRAVSRDRVRELGRELTEAASLGAWAPDRSDDPWYAARVTTADEAARALEIASRLSTGGLEIARERLGAAMQEAGLPAAVRAADWGSALELVEQVRQTLETFTPQIFDIPLADFVGATASKDYRARHAIELGWFARQRLRRQARTLLRPGPPPPDLHAGLLRAQEQRVAWASLAGGGGRPTVPAGVDDAEGTWSALRADLEWLGARLASTVAGGDLVGTPLTELSTRLTALAGRADRLAVLPRVVSVLDSLRAAGLGALVDDLAARGVAVDDVTSEMERVWWISLLDDISVRDPRYGTHDGRGLRRVAEEYIRADHDHLDSTAARVRAAVGRRLREVLSDHPDQEALVRAEAQKSRRHRPLRELLPRAGETLTAIKPCWAMSPLVVASVLPPGRWFDVVIFDEASQIPPAQAVSAISRGTQVVVAGDERQLPPTSFFTAASDDEGVATDEDSLTEGFESVLDVLSAALPVRRLTWHYRSLDERLVAFANERMYDGSLVTFPGTGDESVLRLEVVDGSAPVQPGQEAIESTTAEVHRVVALVLEHARTRPRESLGVIALGITHATRIEEAIRAALATAPDVVDFFDDAAPERFFVKNLERVQGDERDAVILAIGYGKTPHGRVLHRFGPLNLEGGERRLNVAITRARRRMTVVSSFTAADLDPNRLKARGALMLRDFLSYAGSGGDVSAAADTAPATAAPAAAATKPAVGQGDPIVADFARRLRADGLIVHQDHGSSVQRLDLAIEDPRRPHRMLVAVETDGPSYAAMPSARDRDRLRIEQLHRLGWQHVRVWTTDLFRDPAQDVSRVAGLVRAASDAHRGGVPVPAPAATSQQAPAGAGRVSDATESAEQRADAGRTGATGATEMTDGGGTTGARASDMTEPAQPAEESTSVTEPARAVRAEQTTDDTDAGWGERTDDRAHDDWLREQRPPHWG
jgi:hypothetical protein